MSLILTVICSVVGFRFLGPRGAIFGTLIGLIGDLLFTVAVKKRSLSSAIRQQEHLRAERMMISCISGLCAHVASADGSFTSEEYSAFQSVLRDDLRLKRSQWKRSNLIFKEALFSPHSFQMHAAQYYEMFRSQRIVLLNTIELLFRLAVADGRLDPKEEKVIRDAAHIFSLRQDEYNSLLHLHAPDFKGHAPDFKGAIIGNGETEEVDPLKNAYRTLDATFQDSMEEITKKYRKLLHEYHPDKIQSKGLPDGFVRYANNKVLEIKDAYELIAKSRGK